MTASSAPASAAAERGLTSLAAMRARRSAGLAPLGFDPRRPIGEPPPEPERAPEDDDPSHSVDAGGVWTADGQRITRKDSLLARALLAAGVRWHQLMPLPEEAFERQQVRRRRHHRHMPLPTPPCPTAPTSPLRS
eukprot:COSAG01_NODE_5323_length_4334_cov_107.237308_3_plen_135_part_00